jgi:hypothetical protein
MYGAGFADAQLQLGEAWSWGCPPPSTTMVLYDTDSDGSNVPSTTSTTWATQPAVGDRLDSTTVTSGYFRPGQASVCPGKSVSLSATAAAREANNGQWPWVTLGNPGAFMKDGEPDYWGNQIAFFGQRSASILDESLIGPTR